MCSLYRLDTFYCSVSILLRYFYWNPCLDFQLNLSGVFQELAAADRTPVRVTVMGHSFVNRLQHFLHMTPDC